MPTEIIDNGSLPTKWIGRFARIFIAMLAISSLQSHAFDMQSHRGGRGLLPENTLAAFENAIRMGTTTIELDIAITSDGIPVVSHDSALSPAYTRDSNGQWLTRHEPLIRNMTFAEVQTYDIGRLNPAHSYGREVPEQQPRDGQRIPAQDAFFQLVNDMGAEKTWLKECALLLVTFRLKKPLL